MQSQRHLGVHVNGRMDQVKQTMIRGCLHFLRYFDVQRPALDVFYHSLVESVLFRQFHAGKWNESGRGEQNRARLLTEPGSVRGIVIVETELGILNRFLATVDNPSPPHCDNLGRQFSHSRKGRQRLCFLPSAMGLYNWSMCSPYYR